MSRFPTRFQLRTLWNAATGVSILVLGLLIVGLLWLIGQIISFLQPVIVPLAVAGIIAYLLDPVVRWFQGRGLSRMRAVITVFGAFLLVVTTLVLIMIPLVGSQVNQFREARASNGTEAVAPAEKKPLDRSFVDVLVKERNQHSWTQPFIDWAISAPEDADPDALREDALSERLDLAAASDEVENPDISIYDTMLWQRITGIQDEVLDWAKGGTSKLLGFLGLALGFIMVPIYVFFFLKESSAIKEHWHDYVPLKASRFKTELIATLTEVNGYLISFFRGQVLVAFIDGLFIAIGLTLFGLPLSIPIGILMAIVGIIPFVGNIITLIPACVIAYFHFSIPENTHFLGENPWAYVGGVVAIFLIAQQINSLVTAPKIVGDSVGLHPMTVIFSMLFWSLLLGGFVGALLAVPLTAAIKVLFRRYIWERKIKEPPPENRPAATLEAEAPAPQPG